MSEWQPIETAPSDGPDGDPPRILVWVSYADNGEGAVAFGCVYEDAYRHPVAYGYGGNSDWGITHWMPLPTPPAPQE